MIKRFAGECPSVNISRHRSLSNHSFGGFLDAAPVATKKEDLNLLHDGIKKLTERYKENYEGLRKKVLDIYQRNHWGCAVNAG